MSAGLTNYGTQLSLVVTFPSAGSGSMARRALQLASWTGAALAASGLYLYSNKYLDPNDFGAVRVGRAVATVGFSHARSRRGDTRAPVRVQGSLGSAAQAWLRALLCLYSWMPHLGHTNPYRMGLHTVSVVKPLHFRFCIFFIFIFIYVNFFRFCVLF